MNILVAGGAGYIGSHTCVALQESGHDIVIVDSLVNSQASSVQCLQQITGKKAHFIEADVRNRESLHRVFDAHRIDAVINFAGHKAVGESVDCPLDYYDNNLNCAIALLECMSVHGVKIMVFSSSASVYGEPLELPINEQARLAPQNPYGRTKQFIEQILEDVSHADSGWKIANLRYFNPVGAHSSGLIGELPTGRPNNLVPSLMKVAAGEIEQLSIFGGDYDTPDGTAIRDYIHVMDLARGHVNALQKLAAMNTGKVITLNLGTGRGYSVLEILQAFEKVCGQRIAYQIVARRGGDVARCFADPGLAKREIEWESALGIEDMCKDAWNWQQQLQKRKK